MYSLAQSAQGGFLRADNLELDFEGKALDQDSKVTGDKWQETTQASQPQPGELPLPENPGLTPLAARLAPSPGPVLGMCGELSIYGSVIWQNSSPCAGSRSCVWSQLQLALTEKKAKKRREIRDGQQFPSLIQSHPSQYRGPNTALWTALSSHRPFSEGGRPDSQSVLGQAILSFLICHSGCISHPEGPCSLSHQRQWWLRNGVANLFISNCNV